MKRNTDFREPLQLAEFPIPYEENLERKLLFELITSPELIPENLNILCEGLFYDRDAKEVYKVLRAMYDARETIDMVSVCARVDKTYFLNQIASQIGYGTDMQVRSHITTLQVVMQRRRLYFEAIRNLQIASNEATQLSEVMDAPTALTRTLEQDMNSETTRSVGEVINEIAEKVSKGTETHITTGFNTLNWFTYGGFTAGNLVVLAARPSVGKSMFMMQMARAATIAGYNALILSLEMTNIELGERLLSSTGLLDKRDIAAGKVDWENFDKAKQMLNNGKMWFDDAQATADDVCTAITLNALKGRCDIVYIDYLQLMSTSDSDKNLYRQVTEITKRLKKLAKSLKIPIVLLCQLNRDAANRTPQLQDLRDSGSIEQDADIVIMLERVRNEFGENTNEVNMYLQKNRAGAGGGLKIACRGNENYTHFVEI